MFVATLGEKEKWDFSLVGFFSKKKKSTNKHQVILFRTSINQSCEYVGNRPIDKEQDY